MRVVDNLVEVIYQDKIISEEEKVIVHYGLENLVNNLISLLVTWWLGVCFGSLYAGVLLWIMIFPLRKNAGGFHADTRYQCMFFSILAILLAFCLFYVKHWNEEIYITISLLWGMYIFRVAPVETENKVLDVQEKKIYRKRTRIILIVECFLLMVALFNQWRTWMVVITMAFSIVGICLIFGKMKRKSKL